jgi:hypothetical protein
MPRTNQTFSTTEDRIYAAWCAKHGIIEGDPHNVALIGQNFRRWDLEVTEELLDANLEQFKNLGLKFYTEDQRYFHNELAGLTPTEQEALASWNPPYGVLANEYNAAILVRWIKAHNFQVTKDNLNLAAGQGKILPLLQWDDSKTRPQYHDARRHVEDPNEQKIPVNEPLWRKLKREREAREAANQPVPQPKQIDAWEKICQDLMRHGTHSHQAAQKRIYEAGKAAGKQPRHIAQEMEAYKRSTERLLPTSRF